MCGVWLVSKTKDSLSMQNEKQVAVESIKQWMDAEKRERQRRAQENVVFWQELGVLQPPSSGGATGTVDRVLDRDRLLKKTKSAASHWRDIGRALGFSEDSLDIISRTNGLHTEVDYYSEMLSQWLKWAPPVHSFPTLKKFASALRSVGEESLAYGLEHDGLP